MNGLLITDLYRFGSNSNVCPNLVQAELALIDNSGTGEKAYYVHTVAADPVATNRAVILLPAKDDFRHLRQSYSTASTSLLAATAGTRFSVIGGPVSNEGYSWWQVRTKIGSISYEGWIAETSLPSAPGEYLYTTPIAQSTQVVVYGNLNLRSSASTAAILIATMPAGTILNIVGGPEQNEGYTWWQVSGPYGTGWTAEAVYVNPASSAGPAVGQGHVIAGLGKPVNAGDVVGYVSDHGCASSPHLHLNYYTSTHAMLSFADAVSLGGDFPLSGTFRYDFNTMQGDIYYFTAIPRSPSAACHLINSGDAVPPGFGAAYNVLSQEQELLLNTFCTTDSTGPPTTTFQAVNRGTPTNQFQVTWAGNTNVSAGYKWIWNNPNDQSQGGVWFPLSLSGGTPFKDSQGNSDPLWRVGTMSTTIPSSLIQSGINYVLAYVCTWTGTQWKCGCHDSVCAQNFWQLQAWE
jgi:hypothetical protein